VARRLLAVLTCLGVLAACRVDAVVDVVVEPDGTGTITITAEADAELVGKVPGLADDLRFEDAVDVGWVVTGPTATPSGGLTVTLAHDFTGPEEATNLLASIGSPIVSPRLVRTTEGDETRTVLTGTLGATGGFEQFADADLVAAIGGQPFADDIAASGATPSASLGIDLRVTFPGRVTETTGDDARGIAAGDTIEWAVPLDGSTTELQTVAVQRPTAAAWWPRALATAALVLLVAWTVFVVAFLAFVIVARRRRGLGRRRPPRMPGPIRPIS
jgi:hypothetical protein